MWEEFGEAMEQDFGLGSLITGAEVAGAVKHLCSGNAHGVEEFHPRPPQDSGCCRAVLVDMPLQHYVAIGDCAFSSGRQVGWFPFSGRVTRRCVPTTRGSCSSASLGRSTPGCWREESGC